MLTVKRLFTDNEHFNDVLGPCGDTYVDAISWLYDETCMGQREHVYLLNANEVPVYVFLNDVFFIVDASLGKHPKLTIKERLDILILDDHYYIENCVWAAYIWMSIKSLEGKKEEYKKSFNTLKEVLIEKSGIEPRYFEKNHFLWTRTGDTLKAIRDDMKKLLLQTQMSENLDNNEEIDKSKDTIIECHNQKDNIPVSEPISLHDKVRLEVCYRLLESSGVDFQKHGMKAEAARLTQMLTALPESTCKTYATYRDLNTTEHQEEVLKVNSQLQKLGIKWHL